LRRVKINIARTNTVRDRRVPQSMMVADCQDRRCSAVQSLTNWTRDVDHWPQTSIPLRVHWPVDNAEQQRRAGYSCKSKLLLVLFIMHSQSLHLEVPRSRLATFSDWTFSVAGFRLWNS